MSFFAHPFLRQTPQKTLVKIYIPAVFVQSAPYDVWLLEIVLSSELFLSELSAARCYRKNCIQQPAILPRAME